MSESIQLSANQLQGISLPVNRRDFVDRATLSDLLRLMCADEAITPQSDTQPVALRQVRAGAVLFHEGADAEVLNFVRVGMFKTFTTAEDGYEQVLGFAGRGEVLGFDAIGSARHPTAAVALEDSSVYALRMPEVFALCQRLPAFDRALHLAASCQLARRGELADVMAAVAAEVRLARFLVHLADHMRALGQSPNRFVLRMTRRDIASHLGVAHETVSRSFTALAQWGYLRVSIREVDILDMDGLKAFSRSTRGVIEGAPVHAHSIARPLPHRASSARPAALAS